MTLPILFENEACVAVNKPAGVLVHPDGNADSDEARGETVSDWFVREYPDASEVGEPMRLRDKTTISRPGVVHRLDTETSGVLVLAKTQEAFAALKKAFQERAVEKTYYAFCYGRLPEASGTIDRPIGRSAKDFRLRSAQRGARGTLREAVTEYACVHATPDFSFVKAMPKTGRTHQLRAHFKALNHPIVCDRRYAPNHDCALGFTRLALHAYALKIPAADALEVPGTITAPFPDDFKNAMDALGISAEAISG